MNSPDLSYYQPYKVFSVSCSEQDLYIVQTIHGHQAYSQWDLIPREMYVHYKEPAGEYIMVAWVKISEEQMRHSRKMEDVYLELS